jgi:pantoate--beta-alanine ligase
MIIYKEILSLRNKLEQLRKAGKEIGFVPTMGALHDGHLSLIKQSRVDCSVTIASIFVNPKQFNDKKDFEKYPVTTEKDIFILEEAGTDILFLPSVGEMYPKEIQEPLHYDLGNLETILEGHYRPGHFQGVCLVMHRLLSVVAPDKLFLGQKDYQQCKVIERLIEILGLSTSLHIVETAREENGLAMSSRNLRLSPEAKQKASAIYEALNFVRDNMTKRPLTDLKKQAMTIILNAGFEKIDYLEICNAKTLSPVLEYDSSISLIALTAAYIEGVRLIDNLLLKA